jgi:peptidoglycan/xylan/chitin deacetylase (PgdA/CDA1 family)
MVWSGKSRPLEREDETDVVWKTLAVLTLAAAVAVISAFAARRLDHDPSRPSALGVTVEGRAVRLAVGTTLAQAAAMFRLSPPAGELLDLAGRPLRPDGQPGRLLLDGRVESGRTPLRTGDRITVVAGRDRKEPLARLVVAVPGGEPGDPQFTLSAAPGQREIVRGAISHELVSSRFRPTSATRTERAVALTFDDGPSPEYTPRILATLRRFRVQATFFVIGYLAQQFPALVRQEAKLGMVVGNHTYNHPEVPPFGQLPTPLIRDEVSLAANILTRIGVRPRLFRPPGGSYSPAVVQAAATVGERVILWSVDPTDWTPGISPKQIIRSVLSAVRPGSIVELHDGGGDRSATLAALPAIIRGIRARGLRLVTLLPGRSPA